jgi:heterodisulfide reductase subunit D
MSGASRLRYSKFTFKQLMELDACTRCGECINWCPTYVEKKDEAITPLSKIEQVRRLAALQYGLRARLLGRRPEPAEQVARHSAGTFDCTLCARCHEVCPVHIDTRPLWLAMREQLVDAGVYPEAMATARQRLISTYNNLGEPNENRSSWAANLPQPPATLAAGQPAELVYFVGCVSAFFPMAYSIPQSMAQILGRLGVPFATMGSNEWCCGFPLIIAGMSADADALIRHNVEAVRASGARRLVTTCPSCYHTWKDTYPEVLGEPLGFEVLHAVELFDAWSAEGRLRPGRYEAVVTYHDPCDLGRNSGIYEPPRRVLRAIPGVELREMADHHERSLCCGGGGDVEMADPALTAGVAKTRLRQAQDVGAQVVASACQQCKRTIMGAARKEKVRIRALDISEILWEALQST